MLAFPAPLKYFYAVDDALILLDRVLASIPKAIRILIPILVLILIVWFVVEVSLVVWESPTFYLLAFLIWFALVVPAFVAVVEAVRWGQNKPSLTTVSGQPSISGLLLGHVIMIVGVMALAQVWPSKVNFTSPLLRFYQLLFRLITG